MIKVALILGCTTIFCVLGLVSGVLAAKVMITAAHEQGPGVLFTVLIPPAVGAVFGLFVGLIAAAFVRWPNKNPPARPTNLPLTNRPQ